MREKLLDLMKNEGLKPSQLAELLGINPAGISHILAGRNKPGFDLLQKILRRFPRINPDWLLLDSDKMYRDEYADSSSAQPIAHVPSSQTEQSANDLFGPTHSGQPPVGEKQPQEKTAAEQTATASRLPSALFGNAANIRRIVVLYDDLTFESFTPSRQ